MVKMVSPMPEPAIRGDRAARIQDFWTAQMLGFGKVREGHLKAVPMSEIRC